MFILIIKLFPGEDIHSNNITYWYIIIIIEIENNLYALDRKQYILGFLGPISPVNVKQSSTLLNYQTIRVGT